MSNTPWQAVKSHGEIERFKDEHKYIALKITPIIKGKAEPVKSYILLIGFEDWALAQAIDECPLKPFDKTETYIVSQKELNDAILRRAAN